jgi:hypothetical protein
MLYPGKLDDILKSMENNDATKDTVNSNALGLFFGEDKQASFSSSVKVQKQSVKKREAIDIES